MLPLHQPYAPLRPGICPTHWVLELPVTGLATLLLPTSSFFTSIPQAWAMVGPLGEQAFGWAEGAQMWVQHAFFCSSRTSAAARVSL